MLDETPTFQYFACVSDGEFIGAIGIHDQNPDMVNAMSSKPTIVPLTAEQHGSVRKGWKYDGTEFINPSESSKGLVFASSQLADSRYEICLDCLKFNHKTKQCRECGCLMPLKTKLAHAKCPLDKW